MAVLFFLLFFNNNIDMKFLSHEVKAVIFDMDGTLIDSTGIWHEIDIAFFKKRGMNEVPKGYADNIVHMGLKEGAKMTIETYGFASDTVEGIIQEWRNASIEQYRDKIPLKEGAKEIIEYLKASGIKLALATANDEELYRPCLERLGLNNYFDVVIDVNKIGEGKSSPKIYRWISEKLGVEKNQTIVLEDTIMGLKTSYDDGYLSVAVFDKNSINQDPEKRKNCYLYINTFFDLLKELKK